MEYAQLNESGTEAIQVTAHSNVEWDADNFCSAAALTRDGKADQFRVVPLAVTEPPSHNQLMQSVIRDGCELVDGAWQYKWRIDALSAEQIEFNQAVSESARIESIWQAAYDYEFAQISGVAIGMLVLGVLQAKPKALAVKGWSQSIWTEYYTRKANGSTDTDYTGLGLCPHSVPELMVELGL